MNSRYHRQIQIDEVGIKGQQLLAESKVLVVGAGGLGCPVIQYLAGMGVGTLGIIDGDTVELSNIHRQVIYGTQSLGMNKAVAAKNYIANLNPEIKCVDYTDFLSTENVDSVLRGYNIVIDCSDNFATRYIIDDSCKKYNIPWVYASIYKFEAQVSVFNYKSGPTYRDIFDGNNDELVPNCEMTGVLGVLPGIIGMMQAVECVKIILGIGDVLSGKLMVYNMMKNKYQFFNI